MIGYIEINGLYGWALFSLYSLALLGLGLYYGMYKASTRKVINNEL